jgi:hypothetical protein
LLEALVRGFGQVARRVPTARKAYASGVRCIVEQDGRERAVAGQAPRPRGSGSIQWKNGRPYAVYRDLITGKQTWEGFDSEEEAEAFLAQWAADRKAAKLA